MSITFKRNILVLLNRFQISGNSDEYYFLNSRGFCNHTTDKIGQEGKPDLFLLPRISVEEGQVFTNVFLSVSLGAWSYHKNDAYLVTFDPILPYISYKQYIYKITYKNY